MIFNYWVFFSQSRVAITAPRIRSPRQRMQSVRLGILRYMSSLGYPVLLSSCVNWAAQALRKAGEHATCTVRAIDLTVQKTVQ